MDPSVNNWIETIHHEICSDASYLQRTTLGGTIQGPRHRKNSSIFTTIPL